LVSKACLACALDRTRDAHRTRRSSYTRIHEINPGLMPETRRFRNRVREFTIMTTKNTKSVTTTKPVWFITGCSTGFGRELASHNLKSQFNLESKFP
jgi:hypothetical protein